MINLYVLDYHTLFKTNGIVTYRSQLEKELISYKGISLNYIWVNCQPHAGFRTDHRR